MSTQTLYGLFVEVVQMEKYNRRIRIYQMNQPEQCWELPGVSVGTSVIDALDRKELERQPLGLIRSKPPTSLEIEYRQGGMYKRNITINQVEVELANLYMSLKRAEIVAKRITKGTTRIIML